ncbi:MAG: hypothetical protein KME45_27615 [Stenomitos rutilans HA7619-LM2]|nr:hypothetical protein [Stenomitos rutilans HA7619-LM2]
MKKRRDNAIHYVYHYRWLPVYGNTKTSLPLSKTALRWFKAMQKARIRLLTLFLGCGAVGWLLVCYQASRAVWFLTEALLLYLTWAGTGAIALSVVGVLGLVWSATLFHGKAEFLVWLGLPFTPAQHWAVELLLNWLFAMVLIVKIALTNQWLQTKGWRRTKAFYLLAIVTSLGLNLVQFIRILLPSPSYL